MTGEAPAIAFRATAHRDAAFAWSLYRQTMKPLTEKLLEWNEPLQRRLIENDMVSGEASIIRIDRRQAGWMRVRETSDYLTILQLYLAPAFQNRRVGTGIIKRLIDRARRSGRTVNLEVMKNNRARKLYERLGFVVAGESKHELEMTWRGGAAA